MKEKKKLSVSKLILSLLTIVPAFLSLISKVTALVGIETRLAGKSLLVILVLTFVLGSVITTTWISLLAMLGYYLIIIHWNIISILLAMLVLNFIFIGLIIFIISRQKRNLTFPEIRRQFHRAWNEEEC